MQKDFHYYATYCAAYLAGYEHAEALDIAYSAQFVDWCSRTLLAKIRGPKNAATTQLQLELMDANTSPLGLQDITRIWSAFHFLPGDLYAESPTESEHRKKKKYPVRYRNKFRLICRPNGELVRRTVDLARGNSLQAVGIAMHVLADTWAHTYFAGTPSMVINNTNSHFYEIMPDGSEIRITFRHSASEADELDKSIYTNSIYQTGETSIMNLGHGRAGHLPDYSFIRYKYMPAWGDYAEILKDNPSDYMHAFCQMVYAMKCIRSAGGSDPVDFQLDTYDWDALRNCESITDCEEEIIRILTQRQHDACDGWSDLAQRLSGHEIEDFDLDKYQQEYMDASDEDKASTFIGKFTHAAIVHKSMVASAIHESGNNLAGLAKKRVTKTND